MDLYPEDVYELLTPEQRAALDAKLKEKGKVLIPGIPIVPEVSEAKTQGDWSCRKMAAKKYGKKKSRKRYA